MSTAIGIGEPTSSRDREWVLDRTEQEWLARLTIQRNELLERARQRLVQIEADKQDDDTTGESVYSVSDEAIAELRAWVEKAETGWLENNRALVPKRLLESLGASGHAERGSLVKLDVPASSREALRKIDKPRLHRERQTELDWFKPLIIGAISTAIMVSNLTKNVDSLTAATRVLGGRLGVFAVTAIAIAGAVWYFYDGWRRWNQAKARTLRVAREHAQADLLKQIEARWNGLLTLHQHAIMKYTASVVSAPSASTEARSPEASGPATHFGIADPPADVASAAR